MINLTLTILIENTAPENSSLVAEHGLSFFVQTRRKKFLFDCGHTGAAWINARALNVDLSEIKIVALSHSHYDHAGGFKKLLDFAPIEMIITGENFWAEKFSRDDSGCFKYRGCGFDEKFLKARGIEQRVCRDVIAVDDDAWLVGNFKRRYDFETIAKKFVCGEKKSPDDFSDEKFLTTRGIEQKICRDVIAIDDDAWLVGNFKRRYDFETIAKKFVCGEKKSPDDFSDEIVLILRGRDGLTLVTACAHCGILNIVADVRERFSLPIVNVIGGLHLIGATAERITRTLDELKILGVKKIFPCHCSGEEFMNLCGNRLSTGSVIAID